MESAQFFPTSVEELYLQELKKYWTILSRLYGYGLSREICAQLAAQVCGDCQKRGSIHLLYCEVTLFFAIVRGFGLFPKLFQLLEPLSFLQLYICTGEAFCTRDKTINWQHKVERDI